MEWSLKYSVYILILAIYLYATNCQAETFRFCFERWEPYAYTDNKKGVTGESIELVKLAAKIGGANVSFSELPFVRCLAAVDAGQFDFVLHTDKYESIPFIELPINYWHLTFAVLNASAINSLNFDDKKRVLVSWSYHYPTEVTTFLTAKEAKLIKAKHYTKDKASVLALFQHLLHERVDLMLVDRVWADKKISELQLPVRLLEETVYSAPQYVGFFKGDLPKAKRFERLLEKALVQFKSNPSDFD